jgi:hypothetical protein
MKVAGDRSYLVSGNLIENIDVMEFTDSKFALASGRMGKCCDWM